YWFGLVNGAHPSHKDPTNFLRNGKPVGPMKGYSCQLVVDEAIDWLDKKRDADAPFFINLWFNEPHAVIAAPDEIVSRYGALNNQAAIYNGTIDNTDRAIGRLVAKLEKLGELDNTIIHYSSDNGSYRQERSGELRGKKGSHHEGGHRVPGIFYWKGKIPGGRVEKEPAGAVDLLPSICGLLGIDKPKDVFLDGSDLTPLLTRTGSFERHQPLFWMNGSTMAMRMGDHTLLAPSTARLPFDNAKANRLLQQTKLALGDDLEKELGGLDLRSRMFNGRFANREANRLRDEFRAMFYFNEALIPLMKKGGVNRVQLYDLASDLSQERDIASQNPELVARMKKQAAAIHRSVMAEAPEWIKTGDLAATKKPRGQAFKVALAPLVEASCIDCHDADTKTQLNFEELGHDLSDATTFRQWVKIFDRVEKGEMPPAKEPQPDVVLKEKALKSLGSHLRTENLKQQQAQGRVPVRRLTRLELEYTLQDILGVRGNLARYLPPENDSATFATVADKQGISPLHIRSYLDAADAALDEAIELGPKPRAGAQTMDYRNNRYSSMWFERPLRNGGMTVMKTEDAYVMFEFRPHVAQSNYMGYKPRYPGLYRITAEAYGYQAKTPITFGLYKGSDKQGAAQLIGAFELLPGKTRSIELTEFFTPNDFFYPAALDINWAPDGKSIYHMRVKGAHGYKGEGLAIKWLKIEGPLEEEWPPTRTRQLLTGVPVPWLPQHRIYWTGATKEPNAHLRDIVRRLAPKAFRRPVTDAEIESFVSLAKPHHPKDQPMHKMVRAPLRAMFSSPQFLFHRANLGPLNDYAL
ncbi:MAG: sulfatase-like hydrolase/transferase, partial [Halieaceae bacterium]|nr:sulfatase-like hydrolase/transferase [Halieaceae bacterium]